MYRSVLILALLVAIWSCTDSTPAQKEAPATPIERSLAFHGQSAADTATIQFVFRDRLYHGGWFGGNFRYYREFTEAGDSVIDLLTPDGFSRHVNGSLVQVADSMIPRYSSSVNSVWYFALLPFRLSDPAVQAEPIGSTTIRGTSYDKVRVTFSQEGGGEDFEDVFVYWFDTEDGSMDYLAYSYAEDHGIGLRFREAVNPRTVGGIRFQDYVNYKADPALFRVEQLDSAFNAGMLDTLSMIELEEVKTGRGEGVKM